ncbi:MAG: FkbM family methyltransferase [Muribaculaceae bacterium]|nr:FkbM family methyltransferase [Muribaculaceae bacterium]MCM1478631.1 FkbM family methyltransferase [Muribaculaceae bacterium]
MLDFITEKTDCWDFLKAADLPVFIYGMGDGALKIMRVFEEYGIPLAGFFASDEFVRGHAFQGHLVHTLSQIESLIDDFIIVLAFAAGYKSLYDRINEIAARHTLLAPDVPVAGEGLFTYAYCLENAEKIQAVYDMLADGFSRQTYADVLNFKISGKIEYLNRCTSTEEIYGGIIPLGGDEIFADLGAYNGDTAVEFMSACNNNFRHIYAFEPNPRNFRKLTKNIIESEKITLFNAAAGRENGTVKISANEGRMSRAGGAGKTVEIPVLSVDNAVSERVSLLKLDVEGGEREALLGAKNHIKNGAKIICSLYHRNEDMFELPLLIKSINPELKFYVRHRLYIPAWETNLYAVNN